MGTGHGGQTVMTRSLIFQEAAHQYRLMKMDYLDSVEAAYLLAEHETNGVLLNRAGQQRGIDARLLFVRQESFALKYSSEELKDHWTRHPRPNLQNFERQWLWSFQSSER